MTELLKGMYIERFRGIGTRQYLSPFKQFNFFIGANNSGKSTVLFFLSNVLAKIQGNGRAPVSALDYHRGAESGELKFGLGVPQDICLDAIVRNPQPGQVTGLAKKLCHHFSKGDLIFFERNDSGSFTLDGGLDPNAARALADERSWYSLWNALTRGTGGGFEQHWLPETLTQFAQRQAITIPTIRIVPALRQIGPRGGGFNDFSGTGLIDRLAEIQSPDHDRREDIKLFDNINRFLQTVTDRPDARIEVPHNREHILVHMDNKVLPISSLGMGIHEVVMIAAFCTISQNSVICIEEPETHLHPLLQRKLIRYLSASTSNQYFIATHSAAFIDTPDAAIFHVKNDGSQTSIEEVILRRSKYEMCVDLGYRASDLMQANSVVWVEGPSDRIYLNHWIAKAAPDLIEGVHYSIMFYGGRLLSHLSGDPEELAKFISLRSLNQNSHIVLDSDRENDLDQINSTKARVVEEFTKGGSIAWVTRGREIENYVPHQVLQEAVKATMPSTYVRPAKASIFEHALHYYRKVPESDGSTKLEKKVDKVAVSKLVAKGDADLTVLDLSDRVGELVTAIRRAN